MVRMRVMVVVAIVQLFVMAGLAFAQGPGGPGGRGRGPGGPDGPGGGLPLRGVELSEVQRQQVRDITARHRQEMRAEILALLTPDQQAKVKEQETKREADMKQRLERFQQQRQQN